VIPLTPGTKLTLVATPDAGSTFEAWSQACTGNGRCTFTVGRGDTLVFAYFRPIQTTVRISVALTGAGSGRVISDPPGIDCPGSCLMTARGGSTVSLTTVAGKSSTFAGWSGACTDGGTCTLAPSGDTSLWANFATAAAPASCANIAPPTATTVRRFVLAPAQTNCQSGAADASGTLAFPITSTGADDHGSSVAFATPDGTSLGFASVNANGFPHLTQQADGFFAWAGCGYLCQWSAIEIHAWDSSASPKAIALRGIEGLTSTVSAGNPRGGLLLAGNFSGTTPPFSDPYVRAAAMYERGPSGPSLRWGPRPLETAGSLVAAGVDVLGRTLVISDGTAKFGAGTLSAQWFDGDGTPITGEFLLLGSWDPANLMRLEAVPLIGGGLAIFRRDRTGYWLNRFFSATTQALVTVASGAASAQTAPEWMRSRPNTRLQIIRGGQAYAVLPDGSMHVQCSQTVGIVAPDGTWCGSADYPIAPGTCDTSDLTLGADGTVIQQLPIAMEQSTYATTRDGCTWQWWAGALN
jgi:hypothetical protein